MTPSFLVALALSLPLPAQAEVLPDWKQWRGPDKNGIAPETAWVSKGKEPELWRKDVGLGYSNVCLVGGRLYTHGYHDERKEDAVVCLDALTGKEHWRFAYPSRKWDNMHEGGTLTTPVSEGDLVYVLSRLGTLYAFEAESGEVAWKRVLKDEEELKVDPGFFGLPSTPLILPEGLVLNVGRTLLLDKRTGKTIWATKDYGYSYSVPTDFELRGERTLAVFNAEGFVTLSLADGAQGYHLPWTSKYNVNCATPIVVDGEYVFISTGFDDKGSAFLDLTGDEVEVLWTTRKMRNKMTGCVRMGDHLFGFDHALLKCMDLSGEVVWTERGLGNGALLGTPDGRFLVLTEDGELVVAKLTAEGYEEHSRRKLFEEGRCWTSPVLAGGVVFCRSSRGELVALDHRRTDG